MTKMSRRLVVDASVISAASTKDHPRSQNCRYFLDEMYRICHKVVLTPDIEEEWARHFSKYSLLWLGAMRRKRKAFKCLIERTWTEENMASAGLTDAEMAVVHKDKLLIEAALHADMAVVSLDEEARSLYKRIAVHAEELRSLVWVNPDLPEDEAVVWLQSGARLERQRRLSS